MRLLSWIMRFMGKRSVFAIFSCISVTKITSWLRLAQHYQVFLIGTIVRCLLSIAQALALINRVVLME